MSVFARPLQPGRSAARSRRVLLLLATIGVLSLADLYLTILFWSCGAMSEVNPVARRIMAGGSPVTLAAWKLLLVGGALLIFFVARRRGLTELAAWGCCACLVGVTIQWQRYAESTEAITHYVTPSHELDARWLAAPASGRVAQWGRP